MDLKNTALFAVLGSVGMLWSQIKSAFAYVSNFAVVTISLDQDDIYNAMYPYLKKRFRETPFSQREYGCKTDYIRPKSRYGRMAFSRMPMRTIFFQGWRPLFLSQSAGANSNEGYKLSMTCIRGTFAIERMIGEAVEEFDNALHAQSKKNDRFYVRKVFGTKENPQNGNQTMPPTHDRSMKSTDGSAEFYLRNRPILYKREDLGSPISEVPFGNLAYPKNVRDFKAEVVKWKNSEEWYKARNLKWRFGSVFYGPPGTGKTSFARAIGQELDMPIHVYDLTTMCNRQLTEFWKESLQAAPCIVLFEDLDRVFDENKSVKGARDKEPLTLDCLLNCINGVDPADGILVVVTANDVTKLDPALGVPDDTGKSTRPGRLDRAVFFGILEHEERKLVAERILSDCPEFVTQAVEDGEGETGAQFESRCSKIALARYWNEPV